MLYPVLNTLSFAFAIVMNYIGAAGGFKGTTTGEISDRYSHLFMPADYAFSIWSFIYLFLFFFLIYSWIDYFKNTNHKINSAVGYLFAITNMLNGLWIYVFIHERILLSLIIIFVLLICLILLIYRLSMEKFNAPVRVIVCVWWPFAFYLGWIIITAITNIGTYLASVGWRGGILSEENWVIIMMSIAGMIYGLLIYTRNLRETALAGVWGLIAIYYKSGRIYEDIGITALLLSGILLLLCAFHAFIHRDTLPFIGKNSKGW